MSATPLGLAELDPFPDFDTESISENLSSNDKRNTYGVEINGVYEKHYFSCCEHEIEDLKPIKDKKGDAKVSNKSAENCAAPVRKRNGPVRKATKARRRTDGYQRPNGKWEARYRPRSRHELLKDVITNAAYKGFKQNLYHYEFLQYFDSKEEKDSWLLAMKADFQKRKGQASKSKKSTTQNVSAKPRKQRGEQSGLDV